MALRPRETGCAQTQGCVWRGNFPSIRAPGHPLLRVNCLCSERVLLGFLHLEEKSETKFIGKPEEHKDNNNT